MVYIMVDAWIKNLNGAISETKSELRSPLKAVFYDRQSANAVEKIVHTDRPTLSLIDVGLFLIKGK